jgi:hypothetical protein
MGGERAIFPGGRAVGASVRRRGHRGVEIMVAAQRPCPARSGEGLGTARQRGRSETRGTERGGGERAAASVLERARLLGAIVGGHGSGERRRMDHERLARTATVPRTVQID